MDCLLRLFTLKPRNCVHVDRKAFIQRGFVSTFFGNHRVHPHQFRRKKSGAENYSSWKSVAAQYFQKCMPIQDGKIIEEFLVFASWFGVFRHLWTIFHLGWQNNWLICSIYRHLFYTIPLCSYNWWDAFGGIVFRGLLNVKPFLFLNFYTKNNVFCKCPYLDYKGKEKKKWSMAKFWQTEALF